MSLLDLLDVVISPELTPNEVRQLRSLMHQPRPQVPDRPWESGLIDRDGQPKTEVDLLRERVSDLELAVKVLCDLLTQRGMLEPGGLGPRVAAVKQQLAADSAAKEEAEREHAAAARRAVDEKPVACAGCGQTVRQRDSFLSAKGPLCPRCHAAEE